VGTGYPWKLNALSYNPKVDGGQTLGTLTSSGAGVAAVLNGTIIGTPCKIVSGGTTKAPAYMNGVYDNGSGVLAVTSVSNQVVLSNDCPLVKVGDKVTSGPLRAAPSASLPRTASSSAPSRRSPAPNKSSARGFPGAGVSHSWRWRECMSVVSAQATAVKVAVCGAQVPLRDA
jgi:hypothetical protein